MTLSSSQVILLSVSEFAAICRTTPRTIRFYEKAGIIHPAHIHPENSYRYYDEKQTEDVFQIKLLKNFGMSLDEIKNIQKNHVSKVIQDEVKKREEELDEKQKEVAFLKRIKSLLFEKDAFEKKLHYETVGPVSLFCYRIKNGRYDRIAEYFELLHTIAEKLKLETQVEELTTYLDATYNPNSSDIEVSVMCKIPQTVLTLPKNFYF